MFFIGLLSVFHIIFYFWAIGVSESHEMNIFYDGSPVVGIFYAVKKHTRFYPKYSLRVLYNHSCFTQHRE